MPAAALGLRHRVRAGGIARRPAGVHMRISMTFEHITEASIRALVDRFYADIRRDPVLGPIFDKAIGDHWPEHLAKLTDFWSSVMLTSGRYKGNPMAVHAALSEIEPPMFRRWLALFAETAEELFAPAAAAAFRQKAERIAESLQLGLFYRPDQIRARPA